MNKLPSMSKLAVVSNPNIPISEKYRILQEEHLTLQQEHLSLQALYIELQSQLLQTQQQMTQQMPNQEFRFSKRSIENKKYKPKSVN